MVNMTGQPEAVLARELSMCYVAIALVTDMDAGVEAGEAVDQATVFARFAENIGRLKRILSAAVRGLPPRADCVCAGWADHVELPFELP